MPSFQLSPSHHLHYLDPHPEGNPVVLLLHGLGVNSTSWELQLPLLSEAGFRPIAPDLRGFGQSGYPGRSSIPLMAQDASRLLASLTEKPAYVVGISMGGTVALQLALEAPERVEKLMLVNTFAQLKPQKLGQWFYFILRLILVHTLGLETQARTVSKRLFPHEDQTELRQQFMRQVMQADLHAYRAAMRALWRFNALDRLSGIQIPTLVVTSEEDTTVSPQAQRLMAERIPTARQVTIPKAGHAVTVEKPEAFNAIMLSFLSA